MTICNTQVECQSEKVPLKLTWGVGQFSDCSEADRECPISVDTDHNLVDFKRMETNLLKTTTFQECLG